VTSGAGGSGDIQVIYRVAEILRLFSLGKPQITVAEAAQLLGLNRTTVHRYFSSLAGANILERAPDDPVEYMPGRLLLELGAMAQGQRRVLEIAPRHMRSLSLDTGLTVVLSLWGESGPVVSFVSETGTHPILITVRIGSKLDHASAQTRLFIALSKDENMRRSYLDSLTPENRAKFERRLPPCRADGSCRVRVSNIDGVVLAAAVFDERDVAATIALIGTTTSLPEKEPAVRSALLRTAYRITEELGGTAIRRQALTDSSTPFL
jgi:DNA-binding IclR family transcriptional regulator